MKASPAALLVRLRQSRQASLLLFAATLGALVIAAAWFTSARGNLAEAYSLVGSRQQALASADHRMQQARLQVKLATGARQLVDRAAANGFVDQGWGERLINVSQAPLTREQVNGLLSGVIRTDARMFGAEAFELSVTHADEGLFDEPGQRSPPLLMTLRGTLLFRTQMFEPAVELP
ncbi:MULTISPECIES: hypothetical protein [unclassified Lysobacter]